MCPAPVDQDDAYRAGIAAYRAGDFARAIACFRAQIAARPRFVLAWRGLGDACLAAGRHADALPAYETAIALDPGDPDAWLEQGATLALLERHDAAIASFSRALELGARGATARLAHAHRGTLLHLKRAHAAALDDYDRALALDATDAQLRLQRAAVLGELGRHAEAVAAFDALLAASPRDVVARLGRSQALQALGRHPEALEAVEAAHALEPTHPLLRGERLFLKALLHEWSGFAASREALAAALDRDEPAATPFLACVMLDDPALQLRVARAHLRARALPAAAASAAFAPPGERIRIGYFSADFNPHATAYLMAELFGLHDRARFEVVAFSFGPAVDAATRAQLSGGFDRFEDVGALPDDAIAARSRALGIDIAVDLKGYTQGERAGIFARRAAPVQVAYLGHPGTTGAAHMDYLIADHVLVGDADRAHYAEQVVRLPGSYQVNDRRRVVDPRATPPRSALGLPDEGVVFCGFNRAYKLTPEVFDSWARILHAVEGSVLWLLEEHPRGSDNLRREAAARGLDPARLVFARKAPLGEHLARQRAADLFLDTLPCNAHTTASDALWVGLPVITRAGASLASRVAASLLHAVGLPELIAADAAAYEALAIALARDPARRAALREHLARAPTALPLFDTPRFTRRLESAFARMHARRVAGLPPAAFDVED